METKKVTESEPVKAEANNPALDRAADVQRLRDLRTSMMNVQRKFEVPELPGFHLHWFREDNLGEALAGGYMHVQRHEIATNPLRANPAGDPVQSGTDLGSNISIIGDKTDDGRPVRAYLMKIYEELFQDDQRNLEKRNSYIMQAMFGDEAVVTDRGVEALGPHQYKKALYNRPVRKAIIGRGRR